MTLVEMVVAALIAALIAVPLVQMSYQTDTRQERALSALTALRELSVSLDALRQDVRQAQAILDCSDTHLDLEDAAGDLVRWRVDGDQLLRESTLTRTYATHVTGIYFAHDEALDLVTVRLAVRVGNQVEVLTTKAHMRGGQKA